MSRRILLIEDDLETADYVSRGLRQDGFTVEHSPDGLDGLYLGASSQFDAIIVDRMLPRMDGLYVIKSLRAGGVNTPILILSALSHMDERVKGLRTGGDDYLTKPFGYAELSARVENLIRRGAPKDANPVLRCGDLELDLVSRRVRRGAERIELLPREFKLLEYFLRHKDRVVTRTMLLEEVWDYRFDPHTSIIDTHICRLRKKIDEPFDSPLIKTVRGSGYRLTDEAA